MLPTLSPNPSHTLSFYLVPDLFHELSVVVLKSPINMFSLFAFNYHHALLPSPQSEHSLCHIFVPPNQKKILGPGRASFWAPSSHCRVYYFLSVDFYQQKSDLDMPWLALPTVSKNLKPPINEASVRSWQRSDWQWCRALDLSGIHTVCAQTQKHTDANILMCFLTRHVRLGLELNIIVTSLAD